MIILNLSHPPHPSSSSADCLPNAREACPSDRNSLADRSSAATHATGDRPRKPSLPLAGRMADSAAIGQSTIP